MTIYYLGVVLGYINTVILFPNFLEPDQFGLTRLLLSVSIIISQVAQLGTPGMVIRYYPNLKKKVFSLSMIITTSGIILTLALTLLLDVPIKSFYREKSALFNDYFYMLFPFAAAIVYYNLFDSYLRANYKNAVSAFLSNVLIRVIWLGLIIIYSLDIITFENFIVYYTLTYGFVTIISFIYVKIVDNPPLLSHYDEGDLSFIKQIKSFNFFTLLAGISSFLINKVDVVMLAGLDSLRISGIYAIAAYMAIVIRVPASSIARTAPSLVSSAFKKNDLKSIYALYKKSAITQLILCAAIFILIFINYDNILYLLPEEYKESALIFLFLGLTQVIDSAAGINGFIMINSKYYKFETIFSSMLLILTILTNLWLIPRLGGEGAAIATMISIVLYNLSRLIFIWIKFKMQPFDSNTIIALFICSGALAAGYFTPYFYNFIIDGIIRSALAGSILLLLTYQFRLIPEINQLVDNVIKKKN